MMVSFCEIDYVWKILLLVLSQITLVVLVGNCVLSFRHRYGTPGQFGIGVLLLLLNGILYVMMQISSDITDGEAIFCLDCSYVVIFLITVLSFAGAIWEILYKTRNRKIINNTSIKESFDNLPIGVCFFNEVGLPVLCNNTMHKFSFEVCGKDVQFIADLKDCLEADFEPVNGTLKDGNIFIFSDNSTWNLIVRNFTHENGDVYMQYIALDVTDLQKKRVELMEENAHLRKIQEYLKQLSANAIAITREEEILNTKMSVHDEMGRCLMMVQKYLKMNNNDSISERDIISWKRAVSMIKYNNEIIDEDMLWQIRKTCESVKLNYIQTGTLPKEESLAYILTCAVRECVTNAVYHAGASELYTNFYENEREVGVVVTNNGNIPEGEIVEGGGLSTLRRRVERANGIMNVCLIPEYRLTVSLPKKREDGVL